MILEPDPNRVYSNHPCPSVVCQSVLRYLKERSLVFLIICISWGTFRVQNLQGPIFETTCCGPQMTILRAFLRALPIFLNPVIEVLWNCMFKPSPTLSNTWQKQSIRQKLGSGCLLATRTRYCMFLHCTVVKTQSERLEIWTECTPGIINQVIDKVASF